MEIKIPTRPGRCPHCGRRTERKSRYAWLYGSPVRTCGKCGGRYRETCYHEVEIDGFRETDVSLKASNQQLWIAFAMLVVMVALNIVAVSEGKLGFLIISVAFFVSCLRNTLQIRSGKKTKALEKERRASQKRLENREYAQSLQKLGYAVPEKYLQEPKEDPST